LSGFSKKKKGPIGKVRGRRGRPSILNAPKLLTQKMDHRYNKGGLGILGKTGRESLLEQMVSKKNTRGEKATTLREGEGASFCGVESPLRRNWDLKEET